MQSWDFYHRLWKQNSHWVWDFFHRLSFKLVSTCTDSNTDTFTICSLVPVNECGDLTANVNSVLESDFFPLSLVTLLKNLTSHSFSTKFQTLSEISPLTKFWTQHLTSFKHSKQHVQRVPNALRSPGFTTLYTYVLIKIKILYRFTFKTLSVSAVYFHQETSSWWTQH